MILPRARTRMGVIPYLHTTTRQIAQTMCVMMNLIYGHQIGVIIIATTQFAAYGTWMDGMKNGANGVTIGAGIMWGHGNAAGTTINLGAFCYNVHARNGMGAAPLYPPWPRQKEK